ncbi:TetR/AcrR family transcriptional regulator [soil metagenome]
MPKSRKLADPAPSTRDALIDAAVIVVAREGLEAASVKRIAAEAGVTPGLLHYHFPTKEALLEAGLRRAMDAYRAVSAERRAATPPEGQVEALFKAGRRAIDQDADVFRLRLAFAAKALSHPELAAVMRDLTTAGAEETALSFAAARGAAAPSEDERRRGRVMKAFFDGLVLAKLLDPDFPLAEAERRLAAAFPTPP